MINTALPFVYIVDDNPYDIDLVKLAFDDMRQDATFKTAKDGVEAVAYARHLAANPLLERPQLMLLDLNMPRMGGLEALAILRAMPIFHKLPIVILTTSESPIDKSRCLSLGATAYIIKSHRLDTFFQSIRQLMPYLTMLTEKSSADAGTNQRDDQPPTEPLDTSCRAHPKAGIHFELAQVLRLAYFRFLYAH